MIHHPSKYIAGHGEGVIMKVDLILSYCMTCGRRKRFKAVVIEFPGRIIRARPFQLRQRDICVPCVLLIHMHNYAISFAYRE